MLLSSSIRRPAWHNVLPYAFENGNLLLNELDGEEDVDHTVVLEDYIKSLYAKIDGLTCKVPCLSYPKIL